jgi:2-polyprenyl-6-methoxyphenol hydroxylase-like FAD-dependent oxidoreductase
MVAAYVLAGELIKREGHPETALQSYERGLRSFVIDKQKAAEGFARSFAPKTRLGLFLRNQASKAFCFLASQSSQCNGAWSIN